MRPFIMTKLEKHLVADHAIAVEQLASLRERHPKDHQAISQRSHDLLHSMNMMTRDHDHD